MASNSKILIVEDDQFIRELYERELSNEGFKVKGCDTAEKAREILQGSSFDLVLLDIMLPGESGLDFLHDYRKKDKKTDFVLLTNLGQEAIVKQGFDFGAKGYMIKSAYSPKEIVTEVHNFLKK